jgi:hypothetical protein
MCQNHPEDFEDGDIELLADSVHPTDVDGHEDWNEEEALAAMDRDEQAALELLDDMLDYQPSALFGLGWVPDPIGY